MQNKIYQRAKVCVDFFWSINSVILIALVVDNKILTCVVMCEYYLFLVENLIKSVTWDLMLNHSGLEIVHTNIDEFNY